MCSNNETKLPNTTVMCLLLRIYQYIVINLWLLIPVYSAVFLLGVAFVYRGSSEVCFLGNNYLGLLENWGRGLITVALLFKLTMVHISVSPSTSHI